MISIRVCFLENSCLLFSSFSH